MFSRKNVLLSAGGIIVLAIIVVFSVVMDFVVFPEDDVPDQLPTFHHAAVGDYEWQVIIDPTDEDWKFYTDTQPAFSFNTTGEGIAQTVVCMKNAREEVGRKGKDRYFTDDKPYCVGGEGKIKIIPQGSMIRH